MGISALAFAGVLIAAVYLLIFGIAGFRTMSDPVKVALVIATTVIAYGFLNRFQVVRTGENSQVAVVDQLTGEVTFCFAGGLCREAKVQ